MADRADQACRRCGRPLHLHCPSCATCWPDHSCAPTCDAEPEEITAVVEAVEQWEAARTRKVAR